MRNEDENGSATIASSAPSRWEWLPPLALLILAVVYFAVARPGGNLSRFSLFVGLGLLPGTVWRLTGRRSWSVHRIFFAAGLIAFILDNPGLRPDRGTLARIAEHWPLVFVGFAVALSQALWGALRFQRLLSDSGLPIGLWGTLKIILVGSFFNIFLPGSTGGDAYRIYAVTKGRNVGIGSAIASVTLDRFLGLPSLIFVVFLGMALDYAFFLSDPVLTELIPFIAAAGLICLVLVLYLVLAGKTRRRRERSGEGEAEGGRVGWPARVHRMVSTNVRRPATLPLALLYGLLSHVACILSCLFFGLALGVEGVPATRYFLVVPMAMTINAIPGAPGGIGQGEIAMGALLDLAAPGMDNIRSGVVVMLLFRLANIAIGVAGGIVYAAGKYDPDTERSVVPENGTESWR